MARLSYLEAFRLAVTVGKTAALFHVITHYGIVTTGVEGASMLPTVHIMGQTAVISSRYRHGRGVQVGDLVTYDIPISRNTCGLKRVVGMPGDYVTIQAPQAPNGAGDTMMQVRQFPFGTGSGDSALRRGGLVRLTLGLIGPAGALLACGG